MHERIPAIVNKMTVETDKKKHKTFFRIVGETYPSQQDDIITFLSFIPDRKIDVLEMYFLEGLNLEEISLKVKRTKQRVHAIVKEISRKLNLYLHGEKN